jgi:hypothetical protein
MEGENRCNFAARWVELRRDIDFARLRGGKQLVNHIQNSDVVTTKVTIWCCFDDLRLLQFFARRTLSLSARNRLAC